MQPEDMSVRRENKHYTFEELREMARKSGFEDDYPNYRMFLIDGKRYIEGFDNDAAKDPTSGQSECAPIKEVQ